MVSYSCGASLRKTTPPSPWEHLDKLFGEPSTPVVKGPSPRGSLASIAIAYLKRRLFIKLDFPFCGAEKWCGLAFMCMSKKDESPNFDILSSSVERKI